SLVIKGEGDFTVHLRVAQWAKKGFIVKINGKQERVKVEAGSYLALKREWKNGDTIELQMPFDFHLDPVMDQQNIASLFYGPILLAAQEPEARVDWRKVTLDAKDLNKSIQGDPKTLEFRVDGVTFKPFYDTYGRPSVYLDVTLKERYRTVLDAYNVIPLNRLLFRGIFRRSMKDTRSDIFQFRLWIETDEGPRCDNHLQ